MRLPLPAQKVVNADRGPFLLEPVGLDHARFAPEPQAFEEAVDRNVVPAASRPPERRRGSIRGTN